MCGYMYKIFMLLALSLLSQKAMALTCSVAAPKEFTVPLGVGNMYVGSDNTIGRQIFTQKNARAGVVEVICTNATAIGTVTYDYILGYDGDQTTTHRPTNIAGINYEIYATIAPAGGTTMSPYPNTLKQNSINCGAVTVCKIPVNTGDDLIFLFADAYSLSGQLLGSSLSPASVSVKIGSANPVRVVKSTFTGSINITSNTCTTPDVNVSLGSHPITTLSGIGSASTWTKFNIALSNCPIFYGTYPPIDGAAIIWAPGGALVINSKTKNNLTLTLKPLNGVEDAANSVIKLTENTLNAKGVGIQVVHDDASSSVIEFNKEVDSGLILSNKESTSYLIPFKARYFQTQSVATPGVADGKMTFIINYK